ncbi:MAG TPA: hypothetical protein VIN10_01980 [Bacteroidales bacterium]
MKSKVLNMLVLISSLFGFLEWGGGNKMFLFQLEAEVFSKFIQDPLSTLHPFIILPFLGQALLLITLFQKKPGKILTYFGISGIGTLLLVMFLIGCLNLDFKILLSTIPFLAISFYTIWYNMKIKTVKPGS